MTTDEAGSDAGNGGGGGRRKSKRQRRSLAELVAIVRPPGRPGDIRAFAEDELDQAHRYAAETGATVERLMS